MSTISTPNYLSGIQNALGDTTIPHYQHIKDSLTYLAAPDGCDSDDVPIDTSSVELLIKFIKQISTLSTQPFLSCMHDGTILAGWEREKHWHLFIHFRKDNTLNFIVRCPNRHTTNPTSIVEQGFYHNIFDSEEERTSIIRIMSLISQECVLLSHSTS